jgi:hypothetical protein
MWMSQAAYEATADTSEVCEKCKLERILERWGFICRARQGGTEGFVAEGETTLVVASVGTDPVIAANWITDFTGCSLDIAGCP